MITAAHCIKGIPNDYKVDSVRLGEYDLNKDIDCQDDIDEDVPNQCNPLPQDIPVDKLIPHPEYDTPKFANDIGLIRLKYAPNMSRNNIVPICLPLAEYYRPPNVPKHQVIGWGMTELGSKSNILLKLTLPYVPLEDCQRMHGRAITLSSGQICFGGESNKDSCHGDSGGALQSPVTLQGRKRPAIVLFGVVTAGNEQCNRKSETYPGIYANVSHYLNWILDNMTE